MNGKFASKSKKIDDVGFGIIKAIDETMSKRGECPKLCAANSTPQGANFNS